MSKERILVGEYLLAAEEMNTAFNDIIKAACPPYGGPMDGDGNYIEAPPESNREYQKICKQSEKKMRRIAGELNDLGHPVFDTLVSGMGEVGPYTVQEHIRKECAGIPLFCDSEMSCLFIHCNRKDQDTVLGALKGADPEGFDLYTTCEVDPFIPLSYCVQFLKKSRR